MMSNIFEIMLKSLLNKYVDFIEVHNTPIVLYYTDSKEYPRESFISFEKLKKSFNDFFFLIRQKKDVLINYSDFENFALIEDAYSTLENMDNYSRWFRSCNIKGVNSNYVELDFITRQNQTLASLGRDLGFENGDTGELELSIRNKVKELDYTLGGGLKLKANYINNRIVNIQSIIDNLTEDKVLGIDMDRKITFIENDISTLTPKNTFLQSTSIIVSLKRGDNPEIPYLGLDKSILQNRNTINIGIPVLLRQLYTLVGTDDTLEKISIENINQGEDRLTLTIKITAVTQENSSLELYGN